MKDLRKIKKGITHAGKFHTDDVMSVAFIKTFSPDIQITRVTEYAGEPKDGGVVFDIGGGEFDHHQEDKRIDDNGHAYCAFGLLWESYGREYLQRKGFTKVEEAFSLFKWICVYKIGQGDKEGYKEVKDFFENQLIVGCNPLWFEECDDKARDRQFAKAVKLGQASLDFWTRKTFYEVEEHSVCAE